MQLTVASVKRLQLCFQLCDCSFCLCQFFSEGSPWFSHQVYIIRRDSPNFLRPLLFFPSLFIKIYKEILNLYTFFYSVQGIIWKRSYRIFVIWPTSGGTSGIVYTLKDNWAFLKWVALRYRCYGNSYCLESNEKINFGHTLKRCCSAKEIGSRFL